MKPKATTLMQRYGFSDPDLKDAKHDEAVMHLCTSKEEARRILSSVHEVDPDLYDWCKEEATAEQAVFERGYQNKRFLIGFVDVLLNAEVFLKCERCLAWSKAGMLDGKRECHKKIPPYKKLHLYIEVKTKPPAAGELLRQLNTYRLYGASPLAVYFTQVCDEKYLSFIRQQGVHCFAPNQSITTTTPATTPAEAPGTVDAAPPPKESLEEMLERLAT